MEFRGNHVAGIPATTFQTLFSSIILWALTLTFLDDVKLKFKNAFFFLRIYIFYPELEITV